MLNSLDNSQHRPLAERPQVGSPLFLTNITKAANEITLSARLYRMTATTFIIVHSFLKSS